MARTRIACARRRPAAGRLGRRRLACLMRWPSSMKRTLIGVLIAIATGSLIWIVVAYLRDIRAAHRRVSTGSAMVETLCGPIEYADRGKGPPVLVVHGAGGGFDQGLLLGRGLIDHGERVQPVLQHEIGCGECVGLPEHRDFRSEDIPLDRIAPPEAGWEAPSPLCYSELQRAAASRRRPEGDGFRREASSGTRFQTCRSAVRR